MNFGVIDMDDETRAFWKDCRAFFEEHVTEAVLDEERRTGGGFNEGLHLAMGARRWVTPLWSVEEGGAALDSIKARIVAREFARSGAPAILSSTTTLPAISIRMFGDERLRSEVLPGIADGTIRVCLGYTEPDCGSDLAAVKTRAIRDGEEWVINGQKMFTTGAQFCQYCFCLTRTNSDAAKHKGLTVFLVPLDLPGVEVHGIATLGGERTNFVHFDEVRVPDRFRLGPVDQGWTVVSAPLDQEHGIGRDEETGAGSTYAKMTQRTLDAAVAWLLQAESNPDGARLIDDPAILERIGRVVLDIEVSDVTPGPMGRIVSADTLVRDVSDLLDLVGPAALIPHGADGAVSGGAVEYAFRFAPGTTIYGGSTDIHRNLIAERVLGLPRSTPRS